MKTLPAARVFKCLSEQIRLRLIRLLAREELNGSELRAILDIPQSTLSRHLNVLKENRLVQTRREGPHSFFRLGRDAELSDSMEDILRVVEDLTRDDPQIEADSGSLLDILESRRRQVLDHFEAAGETWDTFQSQYADHRVKSLALNRLIAEDLVLVDAGCGSGYMLPELTATGCHIIAVDNAPAQLERAREKCRQEQWENVEFRLGELEALPLEDKKAAAVFAHLTLHHSPSPEAAVREMTRIVAPGGRLVVTDFLSHEETWLREEHADLWLGFDPKQVTQWMRQAGLEHLRLDTHAYAVPGDGKSPDLAGNLKLFILSGTKPQESERT